MFDPVPRENRTRQGTLKLIVFCAAGVLLGLGLCGVAATSRSPFSSFFINAGLFVAALCAVGFVISVLWAIVSAIVRATR